MAFQKKNKTNYKMRVKVWLYPAQNAAWHFATLPKKQSAAIRKTFGALSRGWGSLPVRATIGATSWDTSIFPDKKRNAYLLPLKALVRETEHIAAGDTVSLEIEICT